MQCTDPLLTRHDLEEEAPARIVCSLRTLIVSVNLILIITCIIALSITAIVESQKLASTTVLRFGRNHLDRISNRIMDKFYDIERQSSANLAAVTVSSIAQNDSTRIIQNFNNARQRQADVFLYSLGMPTDAYIALSTVSSPPHALIAAASATPSVEVHPLDTSCRPLNLTCPLVKYAVLLDTYSFAVSETPSFVKAAEDKTCASFLFLPRGTDTLFSAIWTEVFPFLDKGLAISHARPFLGPLGNGTLELVVGLDVGLQDLSVFLDSIDDSHLVRPHWSKGAVS